FTATATPTISTLSLHDALPSLTEHTRLDFRGYRRNTIRRRIERRMGLARIEKMSEYLAHAREHRDELERLGKDLLISVTHFFREDRKSTRLHSSHVEISYAVF